VVNQSTLEVVPPEKLSSLEAELKAVEEENSVLSVDAKGLSSGSFQLPAPLFFLDEAVLFFKELAKVKSTPTDDELGIQITNLEQEVDSLSHS
jgi:hypothetical protein